MINLILIAINFRTDGLSTSCVDYLYAHSNILVLNYIVLVVEEGDFQVPLKYTNQHKYRNGSQNLHTVAFWWE